MADRIVHETPIPLAGQEQAYEYRLPISAVPAESDREWGDWLAVLVGRGQSDVREIIRSRFTGVSEEFSPLSNLVMEYVPFSILVFAGTPLLWLESSRGERRDFIYLPPEVDRQEIRFALKDFQLESQELAVEFLALFGGMGERWPWEDVEFSGRRTAGNVVITPARTAIATGLEYRTPREAETLLRNFDRWIRGIEILYGAGCHYWHLGPDGTVCKHELGQPDVMTVFDSLGDMIAAFVQSSTPESFFKGAY